MCIKRNSPKSFLLKSKLFRISKSTNSIAYFMNWRGATLRIGCNLNHFEIASITFAPIDGVCCADFYLSSPEPVKLLMLWCKWKETDTSHSKAPSHSFDGTVMLPVLFMHWNIMNWETEKFIAYKFLFDKINLNHWHQCSLHVHTHAHMRTHKCICKA